MFKQRGTFNIGGRPYVLRPVARTLSPMRDSRGTGRAIRTVDLGDVTEMSHEAKHELRGKIDDISKDLTFFTHIFLLQLQFFNTMNAIIFRTIEK